MTSATVAAGGDDSFPRRSARTRNFTLGAPRDFRVSPDGNRVVFLRSSGPTDPHHALWVLDVDSGRERLVADPRTLESSNGHAGVGDLPAAERARRERARESGEGIVAWDADPDLRVAVFALAGVLWRVNLETAQAERLDARSGVFDPRISPDRRHVAYVSGSELRVTDGAFDRRVVAEPVPLDEGPTRGASGNSNPGDSATAGQDCDTAEVTSDHEGERGGLVTWGQAEFVAAEEMRRHRGHWWSPCGTKLLVARVDTSPVRQWWISAPANPDSAPTAVRYPAAGTPNAAVTLAVFDLPAAVPDQRSIVPGNHEATDRIAAPTTAGHPDGNTAPRTDEHPDGSAAPSTDEHTSGKATPTAGGGRVDVAWDADGWEYLASVNWSNEGLILGVQSRDQQVMAVLEADPVTGACSTLHEVRDPAWVDLVPGVPRKFEGRLITVEDHGPARRLCVDRTPITQDELQIRQVVHADADGVFVIASTDPAETHLAKVSWKGTLQWLTHAQGTHSAAVGGSTAVIAGRSLQSPGVDCQVIQLQKPTSETTTEPPDASPNRAAGIDATGPEQGVAPTGPGLKTPPNSAQVDAPPPDQKRVLRIDSLAADPELDLNVTLTRLGARRLPAAIVMPSASSGAATTKRLPVLLDPYGGPHAQRVLNAQAAFHTSQWFADQGFAVLIIDGRGTPGCGPGFERAVKGDLLGPALEDQIEGLQAAAEAEPRMDLGRVAIRGWSFGGYLAAAAVLRHPDVFHAAVAGAPVTDWRLYDTHYTERYLGDPRDEPLNYQRSDLTPLAADLRRPLLLIHGLADDNVVVAHTLRLSQALLEAGRFHTVVPLSGITHMTPQEQVAENLLLVQLRFLRQALNP